MKDTLTGKKEEDEAAGTVNSIPPVLFELSIRGTFQWRIFFRESNSELPTISPTTGAGPLLGGFIEIDQKRVEEVSYYHCGITTR